MAKSSFRLTKLVILLFCIILFAVCSASEINYKYLSTNIYNCELSNYEFDENKYLKLGETFVVGHAYGHPNRNDGIFSNNLINFFNNTHLDKNSYIGLTGDIVFKATEENLTKIKTYLNDNFSDYFISPGNHDLLPDEKIFYEVFKKDFYFKEFNSYILISANFSNPNWLPNKNQIKDINKIINNSTKKNVVILSHQIFWQKKVDSKIKPNSYALLNESLDSQPLSWIEDDEKNYIIISGDYGAFGQKTFCYKDHNYLYIANGIGAHENDSILRLIDTKDVLYIEEIKLSK